MSLKGFGQRRLGAASQRGFSLIEVLIALVVLAVGLLGVAMMQMLNLQFTQSANHRTVATNLAYELVDMMRGNHSLTSRYLQVQYDSFDAAVDAAAAAGCGRTLAGRSSNPEANMARWRCEVRAALPEGEAEVRLPGNGEVHVDLRWNDSRWEEADPDKLSLFTVESRL